MIRRVVFGVVLLAVAGSSVSALADSGDPRQPTHELCIAMSKDPDHQTTQDYCITWPGPVAKR
jgi:hypothetical protein